MLHIAHRELNKFANEKFSEKCSQFYGLRAINTYMQTKAHTHTRGQGEAERGSGEGFHVQV